VTWRPFASLDEELDRASRAAAANTGQLLTDMQLRRAAEENRLAAYARERERKQRRRRNRLNRPREKDV
jgi:hypothetical protein